MSSLHRSLARLTTALLTLALALSFLYTQAPAYAAGPGSEILGYVGTVIAGTTRSFYLTQTAAVNIKLNVSGGNADDSVKLELFDSQDTAVAGQNWTALNGETIWATTQLTATGWLKLTTASALPAGVTVELRVYTRGTVLAPTIGGTLVAPTPNPLLAGTHIGNTVVPATTSSSSVVLSVPTAGLYQFALNATSGSFEMQVDPGTTAYLRKIVVSGKAPAAADSTYYLSAGNHTFVVNPDKTAVPTQTTTAWSLTITQQATALVDSLPTSEQASVIGDLFKNEVIPVQVAADVEVNVSVEVAGASTDNLSVDLYNGGTLASTIPVAGTETVWFTGRLTAGANSLRIAAITAAANTLAYTITVDVIHSPTQALKGLSLKTSKVYSTVRVNFPSDGLYDFTVTAASGSRYQLRLDTNYLTTIVTGTNGNTSAYFVPAGIHTLVISQDGTLGASWGVTIAGPGDAADTLPISIDGQTLSSAAGDFGSELTPINLTKLEPVNIRITASGIITTDGILFEILSPGSAIPTFTVTKVYSSEINWATTNLLTGTSLLRVTALANNAPISYTLDIEAVKSVPTNYSGLANANGVNPKYTFNAPVDGIYTYTLGVDTGNGYLVVEQPTNNVTALVLASGSILTQEVKLKAGFHTLTFVIDSSQSETNWSVSADLVLATPPLTITTPITLSVSAGADGQANILGTGFFTDTVVELFDANGNVFVTSSTFISGTQISLVIPTDLPLGTYSVRLRNPATGEQAEQANAVTVRAALTISPVTYSVMKGITGTVSITGTGFLAGTQVEVLDANGKVVTSTSTFVSGTQITLVIPATTPIGTYSVRLTNPLDSPVTQASAVAVTKWLTTYLPLVGR